MAVIGVGIDLVAIERIRAATEHPQRGARFRRRVFTDAERSYCESRANPHESFAVRFAAKEAAIKALGGDRAWGFPWQEIEVVRGDAGRPGLVLHGRSAERAKACGVTRLHLSLSHEAGLAIAQVVLEG